MSGTLEDRVQRILAARPAQSGAQPAPGAEIIRFLMHCSIHGRPFVVVAERHGDTLRMIRNEEMQTGGSGGAVSSPALGSFRLDGAAWPGCLHCGARENPAHNVHTFWNCNANGCGQPFHCVGDLAGRFRCACGKVETRTFSVQELFEVRGARSAAPSPAATTAGRSSPASSPAFTPRQVAVPPPVPSAVAPRPAVAPSSAPRLPWKR